MVTRFADVFTLVERPVVIAVDVPIGLPAAARRGGRQCEVLARSLLGPRKSSVFSSPSRAALNRYRSTPKHAAVSRANRESGPAAPGLSLQTFYILDKISEVDLVLPSPVSRNVVEVHPELCFAEANGGRAMTKGKKDRLGREERARLLAKIGYAAILRLARPSGAKADDVLDACIACWTAERVAGGQGRALPEQPPRDERGLEMAIWV
jgi:predicted RNase H-like nuclease